MLMDNQTFLTLIARALSGEAGDEDLKELEKYFRENDAYKRRFHLLKEYWENKSGISTDTNKALQKVLLQIKDEKKEGTPSIEPPNQKTQTGLIILGRCFIGSVK